MKRSIAFGATIAERIRDVQRNMTWTVGISILLGAAAMASGDDEVLHPLVRPDGAQVVLPIDGTDFAAFRGDEDLILVADDGTTITVPPDTMIPGHTGTLPELMEMWGTTYYDMFPGSVGDTSCGEVTLPQGGLTALPVALCGRCPCCRESITHVESIRETSSCYREGYFVEHRLIRQDSDCECIYGRIFRGWRCMQRCDGPCDRGRGCWSRSCEKEVLA